MDYEDVDKPKNERFVKEEAVIFGMSLPGGYI